MAAESFGQTGDGKAVQRWRLGGGGGIAADIVTYGARLTALSVPGPHGRVGVVLPLPDIAACQADTAYLGATVGRFAGRINGARFPLDGRDIRLPANDGPHTLHGGPHGFERAIWQAEPDGAAVLLHHTSPDGDQGFPGQLAVSVRYAIEDGTALAIDYTATTDAPTVLNLTNHAYFNLAGAGDILGHALTIAADRFVPVGRDLVQSGPPLPVAGTPLDFRTPTQIGARITDPHPQLQAAGGYDHTYILSDAPQRTPRWVARAQAGGIAMDVFTTEPTIQLYTSNTLHGRRYAALCLETQHAPDSPNCPDFPTTILRPGATFRSRTLYRFSG